MAAKSSLPASPLPEEFVDTQWALPHDLTYLTKGMWNVKAFCVDGALDRTIPD